MLGHIYLTIGLGVFFAVVLWEAPILPIRKVLRSRIVRADRKTVWRKLLARPSHRYVADETVPGKPDRRRLVIDTSNGSREHLDVLTYETLDEIENQKIERRIVADHDLEFTPGSEVVEICTLEDVPQGTRVTISHERTSLQSLGMMLATRRAIYNTLDWFQTYCEAAPDAGAKPLPAAETATSPSTLRRSLMNVALTMMLFGSLAIFVSWRLAFLMMSVIIVHEVGHLLAFRIAGHTKPRMILLPFLGGAVISGQPFRSAREEAFVSLMGPGFSALYGAAFMLVAYDLGADFSAIFGQDPGIEYARANYAAIMCVGAAALIGIANAFQMIPVPPLDGGHVWRALLHSDRHRFIRFVFPFVGIAVTALAYYIGNIWLAVLVGMLCLIWPSAISSRLAIPIMSAGEKTLVGSAYVAIALIHLAPVYILMRPFM